MLNKEVSLDDNTMKTLMGQAVGPESFNPEMINTIMRDQSFNPNDFITDTAEKTVRGWRKTVKWTKDGRVFELTTGEGQMFVNDEEEDGADDSKITNGFKVESSASFESESGNGRPVVSESESVGPSGSGVGPVFPLGHSRLTPDQMSQMYALFENFNKMNAFAYDLSFLQILCDFSKFDDDALVRYID